MSFNSEKIASAIYHSSIPIISAVGHETDFSISDLVSDFRASTPTAAADVVVPERKELLERIKFLSRNNKNYLDNIINTKTYKLDALESKVSEPKIYLTSLESKVFSEYDKIKNYFLNYLKNIESLIKGLNLVSQDRRIEEYDKILKQQFSYFLKNFHSFLKIKSDILDSKIQILNSCSYERWLEKGFAIIKRNDNKLIKNVSLLKNYKDIKIKFSDGNAKAKIIDYDENK